MKLSKNLILLFTLFSLSFTIASESKITADTAYANDKFGQSVDISGSRVIVGAYLYNEKGSDSGVGFIFHWNGSSWTQVAKIAPDDGAAGDWFGYSVAIDGDYIIVGAPRDDNVLSNTGSAYIYYWNGSSWTQQAKLVAADSATSDFFGWSVAIRGDYAIVGAPYDDDNGSESGSAYIFVRSGNSWSQQAKLTASDGEAIDHFGWSVSINENYAIIGAPLEDGSPSLPSSGSAYVFSRSGTTWSEQAKLRPADLDEDDEFGWSVALDSLYAVIGAAESDVGPGSAYIFNLSGTSWTQQAKLTASDGAVADQFGYTVDMDSNIVVIGAHWDDDNGNASGSAYSFIRVDTTWTQVAKITASDADSLDEFGNSVAADGDYVICGAYLDDHSSLVDAGSAYIYKLNAYVNVKVFLEGPYDAVGDTMSTALNDNGYLPLSQPFNSSPWNYGGSESVSSIPAGVVDWVLVELRTGTAADTRVASRAAFLKKDGTIVDLDGTSQVKFLGLLPDNYYIVIRHRNHLAVMSANAVTLSENSSTLYDFTTGTAQYYGADAKQLETGVYGMYTGDASANGQVQTSDKNDYWKSQVGTNGYKSADFNLNGEVQTSDKNDYWKNNVGRGTQVP